MTGKNKRTLRANKVIRRIQENFATREHEEPEYYTSNPSPRTSNLEVHLHLQGPKEAEKEVVETLNLEIRVMTKGLPFQSWLGSSLKVLPPRI